jgi:hypothetical protein
MEPKQMDLTELIKRQQDHPAPESTKIHVIDGTVTLEELNKQLLLHEDIFVEINGEDLHRIRKGISSIKAKNNAKLKAAGLPIDKFKIEYAVIKEDVVNHIVRLRIRMVKPMVIQVKKLEAANTELD